MISQHINPIWFGWLILMACQPASGYLSKPPTREDLTQGFFYSRRGGVGHEPKLVRYWSMLVRGSLGAMWTMLAFAKFTDMYTRWPEIQCNVNLLWSLILLPSPGVYTRRATLKANSGAGWGINLSILSEEVNELNSMYI